MEGGGKGKPSKKSSSSSSSSSTISSDLFGNTTKGSSSSNYNANPPSSSAVLFDSVFSTPSTILARESSRAGVIGSWSNKQESPGSRPSSEGQGRSAHNKDRNSFFQEDRAEPCYLSSSLYYGGQDVYSDPSNTQSSGPPHTYKKDDGEGDDGSDLNSASRGNWWQGSLYY